MGKKERRHYYAQNGAYICDTTPNIAELTMMYGYFVLLGSSKMSRMRMQCFILE